MKDILTENYQDISFNSNDTDDVSPKNLDNKSESNNADQELEQLLELFKPNKKRTSQIDSTRPDLGKKK
jgi:hypothetical protein